MCSSLYCLPPVQPKYHITVGSSQPNRSESDKVTVLISSHFRNSKSNFRILPLYTSSLTQSLMLLSMLGTLYSPRHTSLLNYKVTLISVSTNQNHSAHVLHPFLQYRLLLQCPSPVTHKPSQMLADVLPGLCSTTLSGSGVFSLCE